ncbi:MAG: T9SS type A sorting domain-containing protein [Bacteroidia bacterium]|nr:T9SS type A sorting domain-containing protein [Bacteroidia bacterium]HQV00698.1 T9SS type A sorting domain-containing protein [Bacteroidia bacterium]
MKKLLLLSLILGLQHIVFAQVNLVPNPSFEDTVACPNSTNQVDRAVGWYPSRNSPDYFNACDWINGLLGVPNNTAGYQHPQSGDAYCGFIAYLRNDPNYRENFTCSLLNSLIIGRKYKVSFYASWSGKYRLACNKIGALFSTVNYDSLNNSPICNYSHLYTDSIIVDSVNWVLVEGSFIADSNYTYLSIGNFFDSALVDTIYPLPSSIAYYYIDDVSVSEDTTSTILEVPCGGDAITYFPNPVKDKLYACTDTNSLFNIEIINTVGILMLYCKAKSINTEIDLSALESGIYYLKLNFKNKSSSMHKLIKL